MGLFDALRKRSTAVRFSFSVTLRVLAPWPASGKAVAVAWQRGSKKKKRGVTEAHTPKQVQGQLGTSIEFNDVIQISATLYMDSNDEPTPNGPFKKKCLILAIIENSGPHGRDTSALGRVVIDLAEFASMENEVEKDFPVACSRNIHAAVGEPLLKTTIKCRWKCSGGPASMASSMSSDRTGGTFTTNFSAFIRGTENEQIPVRLTNEQFDDLRGFDRLKTINESEQDHSLHSRRRSSLDSGHIRTHDTNGFLVEDFIPSPNAECQYSRQLESGVSELSAARLKSHERQLSRDSEPQSGEFRFGESPTALSDTEEGQNRTGAWLSGLDAEMVPESPTTGLIFQPSEEQPPVEPQLEPLNEEEGRPTLPPSLPDDDASLSSVDPDGEALTDNGSDILSSTELFGHKIESQYSPRESISMDKKNPYGSVSRPLESQSKATKVSNPGRRWKRAAAVNEEIRSRSPSPNRTVLHGHRPLSTAPERSASPIRSPIPSESVIPSALLLSELRSATFLEYSVYLARPGPQKYNAHNIHAPARRIARGISMTRSREDDGVAVIQSALQAIRVMVEACGADVPGMAFWWGNCFQLRLSLPCFEGRERSRSSSPDPADWAARRIQQLIIKMEKSIFDRLQQYLWWKIFIPRIATSLHDAKPSPYHEGNVQKWLSALYDVYEQFALPNSNGEGELGHLHLLRRKIIGNCCRMVDTLLFRELLCGATQGEFFFDAMDSFQEDLIGTQPRTWPKIHPSALPFKKGPLTFGVGMHLKMAVTRWSEWAIEANMKEPQHTGDPGQSFFPSLKATADVLMMPKELLTDASVRGELFAALSIRSLCILLEKFQPDEFAPDPINPEVLYSLRARLKETHESGSGIPMQLQEPPFECKHDGEESDSEGENGFDSESEAEMEALVRTFPTDNGAVSRFELLKEYWVAQRPRR